MNLSESSLADVRSSKYSTERVRDPGLIGIAIILSVVSLSVGDGDF